MTPPFPFTIDKYNNLEDALHSLLITTIHWHVHAGRIAHPNGRAPPPSCVAHVIAILELHYDMINYENTLMPDLSYVQCNGLECLLSRFFLDLHGLTIMFSDVPTLSIADIFTDMFTASIPLFGGTFRNICQRFNVAGVRPSNYLSQPYPTHDRRGYPEQNYNTRLLALHLRRVCQGLGVHWNELALESRLEHLVPELWGIRIRPAAGADHCTFCPCYVRYLDSNHRYRTRLTVSINSRCKPGGVGNQMPSTVWSAWPVRPAGDDELFPTKPP